MMLFITNIITVMFLLITIYYTSDDVPGWSGKIVDVGTAVLNTIPNDQTSVLCGACNI